jgi:hypothetical protein
MKRKWVKYISIFIGISVFVAFIILLFAFLWQQINWTKVIGQLKKLHIQGVKVFFGSFFLILVGFLICSVRTFYKNPDDYTEKVWGLRKTFYVMYLTLIAIGIVVGYIDFRDWKLLTQLTALIVFVDLAVFQTPSITKIWNAEFHHRVKIEKTIEVNMEFINSTTTKIDVFSNVINQTEDYFAPKEETLNGWRAYRQELKEYLHLYTSNFRFRIELFSFKIDDQDENTKQNITNALKQAEVFHSYKIENTDFRKQIVEKLFNGESPILDLGKLIVIPIFEGKSLLLTLKSGDGTKVDEVDVSHLLNLCRIFNWYM